MELEDNRLLALAGPALKGIADAFEAVPLLQGQPIHEPMEPITRLYFLTAGMSSEIAIDPAASELKSAASGTKALLECRRCWESIVRLIDRSWKPTVTRT